MQFNSLHVFLAVFLWSLNLYSETPNLMFGRSCNAIRDYCTVFGNRGIDPTTRKAYYDDCMKRINDWRLDAHRCSY